MSLIIFSVCAGVLQFGFLAYRPLMSFTFSERHDHSPTWRLLLFSIIFCQSTACFSDFRPSPHLSISCFLSPPLLLLSLVIPPFAAVHLPSPSYSLPLLIPPSSHLSLSRPFFFFISVTAVSTGFVMWDSYSHILFSSPRRQQCHTTAAENRGRADTGGRGGRVTRGLLALICVKNAVRQIFSRFNVSVCYSEVRGVRQLLVGVFFRKTGATCKY